jgi:hypothetical protein
MWSYLLRVISGLMVGLLESFTNFWGTLEMVKKYLEKPCFRAIGGIPNLVIVWFLYKYNEFRVLLC